MKRKALQALQVSKVRCQRARLSPGPSQGKAPHAPGSLPAAQHELPRHGPSGRLVRRQNRQSIIFIPLLKPKGPPKTESHLLQLSHNHYCYNHPQKPQPSKVVEDEVQGSPPAHRVQGCHLRSGPLFPSQGRPQSFVNNPVHAHLTLHSGYTTVFPSLPFGQHGSVNWQKTMPTGLPLSCIKQGPGNQSPASGTRREAGG